MAAGEEEAKRLISDAETRAKEIVAAAQRDAEQVRAKAKAEREATLKAMDAELAQAAQVGLAAFRQSVEQAFLVPEIDAALQPVLAKPAVLEEAIGELIKAFAANGMKDGEIELLLPEARKQELGVLFVAKLKARGAQRVEVRFTDAISGGFSIGPKGQGFRYDFDEGAFRELLVRFLSPRFRQAFYGPGEGAKGPVR